MKKSRRKLKVKLIEEDFLDNGRAFLMETMFFRNYRVLKKYAKKNNYRYYSFNKKVFVKNFYDYRGLVRGEIRLEVVCDELF